MVAVATLRADPERVPRSRGGSPFLQALDMDVLREGRESHGIYRVRLMIVCVKTCTLIEPLQRHGLISLPSSWSGPSKQILHCVGPFEGIFPVLSFASFSLFVLGMLTVGTERATCRFDLLW